MAKKYKKWYLSKVTSYPTFHSYNYHDDDDGPTTTEYRCDIKYLDPHCPGYDTQEDDRPERRVSKLKPAPMYKVKTPEGVKFVYKLTENFMYVPATETAECIPPECFLITVPSVGDIVMVNDRHPYLAKVTALTRNVTGSDGKIVDMCSIKPLDALVATNIFVNPIDTLCSAVELAEKTETTKGDCYRMAHDPSQVNVPAGFHKYYRIGKGNYAGSVSCTLLKDKQKDSRRRLIEHFIRESIRCINA